MRLFIAINFPETVKDAIAESMDTLRNYSQKGNFSRRENYHITLAFLGEQAPGKIRDITDCMKRCNGRPFTLGIGHFGRFKGRDGDTIWRSIEAPPELGELQKQLSSFLLEKGFSLEERKFVPHLTVARQLHLPENVTLRELSDANPSLTVQAHSMHLMKSERLNGKLTYTSLYEKRFTE